MRLCLSAALISLGGRTCFALTARGAKIFGPRTGESLGLAAGEDGALIVLASEGGAATLVMLLTEDMDWCRAPTGRLERNP
jgi:hypothetical protein